VDEDTFETLFFAHAGRLVRLAALLGAGDAEDVVQESFCKVFASRHRLHGGETDAAAYLTRTVVNEVRDRQRRVTVARGKVHLLVADHTAPSRLDLGDRDAVVEAVRALPHRQREAVVLRFWLDLPLAAVAEAMGTRVGTTKSQLSRGLAAIAAALGEDDRPEEER
jgi:RNA polymerase sigma factor (sigma-70 family)